MKVEMTLISEELIKPSDATLQHLRRHQLSYLDQLLPSSLSMPLIFFYSNHQSNTTNIEISNKVKKSLSKVLKLYYPVAGRIKDDTYVDCNDQGVLFVEAQANCKLSDVLERSDFSDCRAFVPILPEDLAYLVSYFQLTFFKCGGFAISFALHHKLGDGLSMITFFNTWAAITRGDNRIRNPIFSLATLFPPKDLSEYHRPNWLVPAESIASKRFVFDAMTIDALKAKCKYNTGRNVSRTEALRAFIVSRILASTKPNRARLNHYNVYQPVNLRPKMNPPLSQNHFGNIFIGVSTQIKMDSKDEECYGMIETMKETMRNVNENFLKNIQETDDHLNFLKEISNKHGEGEGESPSFIISSLCNFPIYEGDFGWGKPVWFAVTPALVIKDSAIMADAKDGKGVEAWIHLEKQDMEKFENDKVLLANVSSPNSNLLAFPGKILDAPNSKL